MLTGGTPDVLGRFVFYAVMISWCLFAVTFIARRRPARRQETRRDWTAMLGFLIQSAGYFIIWLRPLQRPRFSPLFPMSNVAELALAVLTVAIAVFSVWLVNAAVRALGAQWAVAARLVEGHNLIVNGPYRWVRNPIYAGMFGMMLATGLAVTQWPALLAATLVFLAGTYLRVRTEERLLRGQFGSDFDEYTSRVPAIIPGVW